MVNVTVEATWRSSETFEFDSEEEAQRFRERVASGGSDGLTAIVDAGDITTANAELVDWEVIGK